MEKIIGIVGALVALIASFFAGNQYTKRKTAEKNAEAIMETSEKQQKATAEIVQTVAKEKKEYEKKVSNEAPQKVANPTSSAERVNRLRKQSNKSGDVTNNS